MKLRLTLRAEADLIDIAGYIHSHDPRAARRVEDSLLAAMRLLTVHPQAGRRLKRGVRRLTLPRYPYLIYYRIDEDELRVLTIRHAARQDDT